MGTIVGLTTGLYQALNLLGLLVAVPTQRQPHKQSTLHCAEFGFFPLHFQGLF
jgi:hypothetical protein